MSVPSTHPSSKAGIDLSDLIGHREWVASDCPLETVHQRFGQHGHDFMAVIGDGAVLGVCSRLEVGMKLGARYGFSLFSRKPASGLLAPPPVFVWVGQPIDEVLQTVFCRVNERFYDDVVLTTTEGKFEGFIPVHALVRLQTEFLRDNVRLLETQQQVIREKNDQMEEDLRMAREIQLALLPAETLVFPPGAGPCEATLRFARLYRPAQTVGGDFTHVVDLPDGSVGIFIADVMGHGVRSALVTTMLRALVEEIGSSGTDPGRFLTELNRSLAAILRQTGETMFATAFYLIVDAEAGRLRYSRAGHPCPVIHKRRSGVAGLLECRRPHAGPGLCVLNNASYGTAECALDGDERILLFTDGLIEAADPDGEIFGEMRLKDCVAKHAALDVAALVEAVCAEAAAFSHGAPFEDDVCVVALDVTRRQAPVEPPDPAVRNDAAPFTANPYEFASRSLGRGA